MSEGGDAWRNGGEWGMADSREEEVALSCLDIRYLSKYQHLSGQIVACICLDSSRVLCRKQHSSSTDLFR